MPFKKSSPTTAAPDSPEQLFMDFPRRKYSGVLDHQGQILRTCGTTALQSSEVALQLPTGSGKTLVGLLIAEWRRRKFSERVLYLCPTNQLVNQVVEESVNKYGLDVNGYTGSARAYDPTAKSQYTNADRVAVTNYNSLFNTNPFFKDPDLIIVDDAHAAENYIAQLWTFRVERFREEHSVLFAAISGVLKSALEPHLYVRLTGEWANLTDRLWVDKIPTPDMVRITPDLREVIDLHVGKLDLKHPWMMISEHLHACQLYISSSEILIRPLIPPTWTHPSFEGAKQRIFMSATLGAGGDLERLTGRRHITRLAIPQGWDRQGIGRRFFIFPGMSLDDAGIRAVRRAFMSRAGRSLVLVPTNDAGQAIKDDITENINFKTFSADDIESTKAPFIQESHAVAVVANRYDGIDFPGDDCRLLFIEGLPRATNLQERFLMTRMGANLLFNERVQTRVLQAVGRCTRSLNDFSAVVVTGEELPDYLTDIKRRRYLHPELQAELGFGIEQSQDVKSDVLIELLGIFLEHGKEWEDEGNKAILTKRDAASRIEFPAMNELESAVCHEINFQVRMWQGDYEKAFEEAREVIGVITHSELRGYRAWWHYMAGSAALLAEKAGVTGMASLAREQFTRAKETARGVPWLVTLARHENESQPAEDRNAAVFRQIERVESNLMSLGKLHNRAYSAREHEILGGLASPDSFEQAQLMLGELLGFNVGKIEADGTPDPWWLAESRCLVFEDHAGAKDAGATVNTTKARQAASHTDWIHTHVASVDEVDVLSVMVTPAKLAKRGAEPSLKKVALWPLEEFCSWAQEALAILRDLRTTFSEPGDLEWRIRAAEAFERHRMDAPSLYEWLSGRRASDAMTFVD